MAAQALLNRRRARSSPIEFAGYIDVPGRPLSKDPDSELFEPVETNLAPHHKIILEAMDRTSRKDYGRLLMMLPPGSAKTTYASIVFPSWYMGKNPNTRLALGMYGNDIAMSVGRKTRSVITQPRYKQIFDVELSKDSKAGDKFALTNGSNYMADSIGGQFPGNRFECGIVDDPIKGYSEANSPVEREKTWNLFLSNITSRIVPGGWLVVIMTHWDEEDPAGRILPEDFSGDSGTIIGRHDGLEWEVLCLQARCENSTDPAGRQLGEYLWPEWFGPKHWQQFEPDRRAWTSLFQQLPRAIEGAFFSQEMLLVGGVPASDGIAAVPAHPVQGWPIHVDYVCAFVDSASKTGNEHDGTAVAYFARTRYKDIAAPLILLDYDYLQIQVSTSVTLAPNILKRLEELSTLCKAREGVRGVWVEDKGSGIGWIQQSQEKGLNIHPIESKLSSLGKKERAQAAAPYVAAGMVKVVDYAFRKVVTFKGSTKNHMMAQILRFSMESGDRDADDCLDAFCYGVVLALGNRKGY
jgi:hypothetical protein